MKLAFRSVLIILLYSCLSIFYGCPPCSSEVPITINQIDIRFIDNSGERPQFSDSAFQQREALAFAVILYDSIYYYPYYAQQKVAPIQFVQTAQAWSCEQNYYLNPSISDVRITTLYDINSSIKSNEDVTDYFVSEIDGSTGTNLYFTIDEVIGYINNRGFFWSPYVTIFFYLTQRLEEDLASFEIQVTLTDGQIFKATTPHIYASK